MKPNTDEPGPVFAAHMAMTPVAPVDGGGGDGDGDGGGDGDSGGWEMTAEIE